MVTLHILLFPLLMPETVPNDYVKMPEEEFTVNNKPFIERVITESMLHISLTWHPWSLNIFTSRLEAHYIETKIDRPDLQHSPEDCTTLCRK